MKNLSYQLKENYSDPVLGLAYFLDGPVHSWLPKQKTFQAESSRVISFFSPYNMNINVYLGLNSESIDCKEIDKQGDHSFSYFYKILDNEHKSS